MNEPGRNPDTSNTPTEKTVEKLDPAMGGVWLVVSQGSQHIWDLDTMTYTRVPGARSLSGKFAMDGKPIPIARVERWPQVGATSLFFFDDSTDAARYEHYRQSSRIDSITRVAATATDASKATCGGEAV
ncbi:hypothetical protein [Mycolicibacterium goodii]|uniref:Uncharacterized protein n=1 Tax=Mycolicibacterium goodii TaxID=134601 RepID=A0ABS6HWB4_MYCGD|nr:hypothetical protein [Mycolicibacterium goodii]MBU8826962.1 hypothetical protein [Mycolicibacterium goodii]MBU8841405.1 hypothetical protein [Mycolicibacterium goodii]